MASSNTSNSDVTGTFSNSESDDELDTNSVSYFASESDSEVEEQDTEECFEERRWESAMV
jgi:hypothetical protein